VAKKQVPKAPGWRKYSEQKIEESRGMPPSLTEIPAPKPTKDHRAAMKRADDGAKFASEEQAAKNRRQSNKEVVEDQKKERAQP
jgi:hypothetical protein